jgi:beta-galactosidase
MTKYTLIGLILLNSTFPVSGQKITRDTLFNFDWKFYKGEVIGAENPQFNDTDWRKLDLPHDWSIEDLTITDTSNGRIISGPFDSKAIGGNHTGFTVGGTGWYRKQFRLPESDSGKTVYINFDGVYMNSDIWINGHHVGNQPYGYTPFWLDLTSYINFGDRENVLAVQVKNEGINSRWYSGSGIYRDVKLSLVNKIHVAPWGVFIKTPVVSKESSTITIETTVKNNTDDWQDIEFTLEIESPNSRIVAVDGLSTRLNKHVSSRLKTTLKITNPDLWSPDFPNLYKAICKVKQQGIILDKTETKFGVRTITFDTEKGMFLNGKSIRLRGGSMHANNGPLGAATYERAEERRVEIMKERGFNAVRCGHNPPSSSFLNSCDKLGLLVIDETFDVWTIGWLPDDYHVYFQDWWRYDVKNMIMRDRNHPSIFAWSIGNQLRENSDSIGIALAYEISDYVKTLDNTRRVTANIIVPQLRRNARPELWYKCDPFFAALDICGYSYQSENYLDDHRRLPDRIMFSSEIDPRNAFDNWMKVIDNDFVIGNFTWTAIDFMGEVSLGWYAFSGPQNKWPWTSTYSGDIDLCGFRRPRSYYRDILFNHGNKLSTFVHSPVPSFEGNNISRWGWDDVKPSWTWSENEVDTLNIDVYSAYDSVELILNGKSYGKKPTSCNTKFKAFWKIKYEPGVLKAIGYEGNKTADSCVLKTAGEPFKIRLSADRSTIYADNQDLCFVTVEILDENNILVPYADNLVKFNIKGEGTLAAVGNGNPVALESFQQPYRKAYEGKCLLIVKSTDKKGKIVIKAGSENLLSDKITLQTIK